jgi:serine/threonine protein phosphatase 1
MKYYVVSDVHGHYSILHDTLEKAGFFSDTEPHKLVICGDLLDRGAETVEMQAFLISLLRQDLVILIRGNHEDLMEHLLDDLMEGNTWLLQAKDSVHNHNGTWQSALLLADMPEWRALSRPDELVAKVKQSPYWKFILPACRDYFETEHYVFTHGYIPCKSTTGSTKYATYKGFYFNPDWREADYEDWANARWYNGMEFVCKRDLGVVGKTVVCGHVHATYGHSVLEKRADGKDDYTTFYGNGVVCLDACTAVSGFMNCLVVED